MKKEKNKKSEKQNSENVVATSELNIEKKVNASRKQKIHKKKMAMAVVFAGVVIYLFYIIYLLVKQPTDVVTVEKGKLYLEETNVGYLIRKEQVVKGNNYKNGMEQIKAEGEKAAKGEAIFRYYSKNEDTLKKQIAELDIKVQEAMKKQTDAYTPDMKLLENQIDTKVEALNKMSDVSKLEETKKEISDLVTKKAKIAGDNSTAGSYLNQLITQRKNLEKQLNDGAEKVVAPDSGIVSYKVDGLEETLTPDNFSSLSKKYLESLDLKTGKMIASSTECGKIVDNFNCYIATISSSEEAKTAKVGDRVKVRLSNNSEISSEIVYISQENEQDTLLILRIDREIEELTNYRKISFDLIWWSSSGLKVPNQAIVEQDGLHYVVRNRAGYLSKILVNVERQNDKYSIVSAYEPEKLKEMGYTTSQINNYKSIALYDEILLYPDL